LRGGEGTVVGVIIGTCIMRVIQNGISLFQVVYRDAEGIRRTWHADPNWENTIVGAVILIAVMLDQVVHIVQARRRTRKAGGGGGGAGDTGMPKQTGYETVPVGATTSRSATSSA